MARCPRPSPPPPPAAPPSKCAISTSTLLRGANSSRSPATEFAHCDEMFERIALSRPDVRFSSQHNGRAQSHLHPASAREAHPCRAGGRVPRSCDRGAGTSRADVRLAWSGRPTDLFAAAPATPVLLRQRPLTFATGCWRTRCARRFHDVLHQERHPAFRAVSRPGPGAGRCECPPDQDRGALQRLARDASVRVSRPRRRRWPEPARRSAAALRSLGTRWHSRRGTQPPFAVGHGA